MIQENVNRYFLNRNIYDEMNSEKREEQIEFTEYLCSNTYFPAGKWAKSKVYFRIEEIIEEMREIKRS
jgi:hypothetical protein